MDTDNTRLKRLLDKKRRALKMPKSRLGELEDEYADLLSRIDAERKRLGIDDDTVEAYLSDMESRYKDADVSWLLENTPMWKEQLKRIYRNIRKCTAEGDADDYSYYKNRLTVLWNRICTEAHKDRQLSLI